MIAEASKFMPAIERICRERQVQRLWLFGSATGRAKRPFTDASDIDLLIEFRPGAKLPTGLRHPLFTLGDELSTAVSRTVQVVEYCAFNNPFFREEIEQSRELIYDDRSEKALVGHR